VARSRGFGPVRNRTGNRRSVQWELGPGADDQLTFDAVSLSTSTTTIFGSGAVATEKLTVVRIRGFLNIVLLTNDSTPGGFNWSAGIGIVTSDAFAIGISAMPSPFDDIEWPGWLWHQMGAAVSPVTTAGRENYWNFEIDTKAMRKMGINEVLFASIQTGEISTSTASARLATRALIKLI